MIAVRDSDERKVNETVYEVFRPLKREVKADTIYVGDEKKL